MIYPVLHEIIKKKQSSQNVSVVLQTNVASLFLLISVCPTHATLFMCPPYIAVDTSYTLNCASSSSNPASTLLWYENIDTVNTTLHDPIYFDSDYNGKMTAQDMTISGVTKEAIGISFYCEPYNEVVNCTGNRDVCTPEIWCKFLVYLPFHHTIIDSLIHYFSLL